MQAHNQDCTQRRRIAPCCHSSLRPNVTSPLAELATSKTSPHNHRYKAKAQAYAEKVLSLSGLSASVCTISGLNTLDPHGTDFGHKHKHTSLYRICIKDRRAELRASIKHYGSTQPSGSVPVPRSRSSFSFFHKHLRLGTNFMGPFFSKSI